MPTKKRKPDQSLQITQEEARVVALFQRYLRKASTGSVIAHHADCHFWSNRICTCGLLHDVAALDQPGKVYKQWIPESCEQEICFNLLKVARKNVDSLDPRKGK